MERLNRVYNFIWITSGHHCGEQSALNGVSNKTKKKKRSITMIEFNKKEEIEKYYDKETNTYIFSENNVRLSIKFNFKLDVNASINARNIDAWNIKARNIDARNIDARNINALNINARNINAFNIDAWNIDARNIKALNINARNINAWNIEYYAVCVAYRNLKCHSIEGTRENSIHICLDNPIEIKSLESKNE